MRGGLGGDGPLQERPQRRARLSFELSGSEHAPVLVLASSMGTSMAMWDDQLAPLGEHLRVLR